MADDPISKMRALKPDVLDYRAAKREETVNVIDRKAKLDITFSPDARKARDYIKAAQSHSLPMICRNLIGIVGDVADKHRLEEAFERYANANTQYMREELKPTNQIVEWMGPRHGVMPELPPGTPEHKVEFAAAWNEMLRIVNLVTKVGVIKYNRYRPIEIQVDVDATQPDIVQVRGVNWDS
jgi:hypothetical protein